MNSFRTLRAPAGRLLFTRALTGTIALRARASGRATINQALSSRVAFASAGVGAAFTTHSRSQHDGPATNFFELKAKGKRHQEVSMSDFENKVILVVNVASKCGFTDQYAELELIYKKYKDKGFTVIGFPCNQFGGQVLQPSRHFGVLVSPLLLSHNHSCKLLTHFTTYSHWLRPTRSLGQKKV